MYKLLAFATLLAVATAAPGIYPHYAAPLAAPLAAPWGHGYGGYAGYGGYVGAPLVSAPVVKAAVPVATSYANTVRIASPAVVAAPAPYAVAAHAPVAYASPYGHPW